MKTTNIINKFTLRGLHGYKNIELDCSSKASIFISENGAGKTTILNSLYWILNNKISNLYKINFKTIELELGNKEKKL